VNVTASKLIEWDSTRHGYQVQSEWFNRQKTGRGNLLFNDGSAQSTTTSMMQNYWQLTGCATNRLAIP
jgi:hypothetical protein